MRNAYRPNFDVKHILQKKEETKDGPNRTSSAHIGDLVFYWGVLFSRRAVGSIFSTFEFLYFCSCLLPRYDWKWNTKTYSFDHSDNCLNNMCPAFELWYENNLSKMSSHRKTRATSTFLIFRPCFFRAVLLFRPFYWVALHSLPSVGWSHRSFFYEKKSKMYSTVR